MLLKAIVISIPVFIAFGASAIAFTKERTLTALVQFIGAVCLLAVVFAHVSEAFDLLPSMGWGKRNTPGHYVDLASTVIGVTLLAVGYFLRRAARLHTF